MTHIHFHPDDRRVESDPDTSVLAAALGAGISHTHSCGGNGQCSTCRVRVVAGLDGCIPRSEKESEIADRLKFPPDIRLACQLKSSGDLSVRRLVIDDADEALTSLITEEEAISTGEEKAVAILFSDIRDFTPFSEALPAYDVMHVLNRYFHAMAHIIEANGGYVDNYMGDGLLALFGVEKAEEPGIQAVTAGIEMLRAMEEFQDYLRMMYGRRLRIGIGIHYGKVVIGVLGACNRRRKTAIGDEVNLASRIEAANKELNTTLLISEPLLETLKDRVAVRGHGPVRLKGKHGEYRLFEVCRLLDPGGDPP